VQDLKVDLQMQPSVPSDYMAVWVKVDSPMERINKAKEEHAAEEEVSTKGSTVVKESGAEEKLDADGTTTSTLESDGAIKKSLPGCSFDGKHELEVRRKSVGGNSSCSKLSAAAGRKKSASRKSSCSDADAVAKPHKEQKEGIASQPEDGDGKKQSPVVVLGSQSTRKVSIGDGDSSSVSEVSAVCPSHTGI